MVVAGPAESVPGILDLRGDTALVECMQHQQTSPRPNRVIDTSDQVLAPPADLRFESLSDQEGGDPVPPR